MGILGVGTDILHITRINSLILRRGLRPFAARVLSPTERLEFETVSNEHRARYLAVRWTVKEAAYKALFPTVKVSWKQLSFTKLAGTSKPVLRVDSDLDGLDSLGDLHASISHDGEYVVAHVVAEKSR